VYCVSQTTVFLDVSMLSVARWPPWLGFLFLKQESLPFGNKCDVRILTGVLLPVYNRQYSNRYVTCMRPTHVQLWRILASHLH
jgi:hypothetical protein